MPSSACWARAGNISASSAIGARPEVRVSSSKCRICSPAAVPPGSRVTVTERSCFRRLWASRSICVLLPQPSSPSKVMNLPRRELTQEIIQEGQPRDAGVVPLLYSNVCARRVQEVHAGLDFLSPVSGNEALFSAGASTTEKLALISWNQVLLYPKGWTADQITYSATMRIPAGWKFGTPLPVSSQSGDEVHFSPVSLYTLVDSPVITGEYLKIVPLN